MQITHNNKTYIDLYSFCYKLAKSKNQNSKTIYQYIINYIRQTVEKKPSKKKEAEIPITDYIELPTKLFISESDLNKLIKNENTKKTEDSMVE